MNLIDKGQEGSEVHIFDKTKSKETTQNLFAFLVVV